MPKPTRPVSCEFTLAGERLDYGWYAGDRGPFEGALVVRTDRFGQRWRLEISRGSYVTARVAAGLLAVTPVTVANWLKAGEFPNARKKNNAVVIPLRDVERIARQRGQDLPFPK